jgi:hypothetical protein
VPSLRRFLAQPWRRKRLVPEALGQLLRAWWLVRRNPFASYAPGLGQRHAGEARLPEHGASDGLGDLTWSIEAVNGVFGGRFTCLMQGIAGKAMLDRRGIPNVLVIGAKLGEDPAAASGALAAHAWLSVGSRIVLGEAGRADHVPLASYASPAATSGEPVRP